MRANKYFRSNWSHTTLLRYIVAAVLFFLLNRLYLKCDTAVATLSIGIILVSGLVAHFNKGGHGHSIEL